MLRDSLVSLLASRLGNRTDLDAAIVLEMQLAQSTLLEGAGTFTPWFLESEMSASATVLNEERVPLPTDYLGPIEGEPLWLYDTTNTPIWSKLVKKDAGYLTQKFTSAGRPTHYALANEYLLLAPVPNVVYALKMRYYAKDAVLSTNITNKWLTYAEDLVIAVVGEVMAKQHIQNPRLATTFAEDAVKARGRLFLVHESRQHTGRSYQMGED